MPWVSYSELTYADFEARCETLFPSPPGGHNPIRSPVSRFLEAVGLGRTAGATWRQRGHVPKRVVAELEMLERIRDLEKETARLERIIDSHEGGAHGVRAELTRESLEEIDAGFELAQRARDHLEMLWRRRGS